MAQLYSLKRRKKKKGVKGEDEQTWASVIERPEFKS